MFYIGDLFQWERFITPSIIKLFYWLVFIIAVLSGLRGLVSALGTMAINPVAGLSIPEPTLIVAQPFDPSQIGAIEKAIRAAGLGLNPANDGKVVRIPLPALTEERRKELARSLGKMAEEARVRVRSNRRAALDEAKKLKAAGELTEDGLRDVEDEVQKLTDRFVKAIDDHLTHKEAEIMKV